MRALGPGAVDVPARDSWVEVIGTAAALEEGAAGEVTAGLVVEQVRPVSPSPGSTK